MFGLIEMLGVLFCLLVLVLRMFAKPESVLAVWIRRSYVLMALFGGYVLVSIFW